MKQNDKKKKIQEAQIKKSTLKFAKLISKKNTGNLGFLILSGLVLLKQQLLSIKVFTHFFDFMINNGVV